MTHRFRARALDLLARAAAGDVDVDEMRAVVLGLASTASSTDGELAGMLRGALTLADSPENQAAYDAAFGRQPADVAGAA